MQGNYVDFLRDRYPDLLAAAREHLAISAVSILLGILAAVPLGIYLANSRNKTLNALVFSIANLFQTVPSLALLAILIPLFGIGAKPAVFALFLYSLLPILRNTYAGFQSVDPAILESAEGMGYSPFQRLLRIQFPLALPYIMSGIRLTTVYIISWTTLASLIGAGGLGQLIVSGIGVNKEELIVSASICAIALALLSDRVLGVVEKRLTKRVGKKPEASWSS
jgi:osmoprotectant transport system permease protein